MDKDRVKRDSFDTMWAFLQMGKQRANVSCLRGHRKRLVSVKISSQTYRLMSLIL